MHLHGSRHRARSPSNVQDTTTGATATVCMRARAHRGQWCVVWQNVLYFFSIKSLWDAYIFFFLFLTNERRGCDLPGYMDVAMAVDDGAWGIGFFFFNAFMRASKLFLSVEDGS